MSDILHVRFRIFLTFFSLIPVGPATAEVIFNEIVTSNSNTTADADGDHSDWLELRNTGTEPVELSGWGITDAPAMPFKWTFPSPVSIPAGGHLVVWASGKNRTVPGQPLHTNFSISASGETLRLTRPDGISSDSVPVPALPANTSYGHTPENVAEWFYFESPTPGTANTTAGYPDLAMPPEFSHAAGFRNTPFTLALSATPGWQIYYTLDGSVPDASRVGAGALPYRKTWTYSDTIPVASRAGQPNVFSQIPTTAILHDWLPAWTPPAGEIFKGTVVRAIAVESATGRQSGIITRTFFVDPQATARYAGIPVVSLVSDYDNLFSNPNGIYVPGNTHGGNLHLQNFHRGWERPASIEFFDEAGALGFADDFDIKNQGSTSPSSMQKGLSVSTGPASLNSTIQYPLFSGVESRVGLQDQFRRFNLRAWGSARKEQVFFSDAYHQTLAAKSQLDIQDYKPVVVFINGEYWGLHELRESSKNSWYHQFRTGIDRDDPGYDLLDSGGTVVDEGDSVHWDAVVDYMDTHGMVIESDYDYISTRIDIPNLVEYIVHCTYTGKRDWPAQNEALWRPRTADGRWRWTQFDMDHGLNSFGAPEFNMFTQLFQKVGIYGPHLAFSRLHNNPRFRRLFVNTYADWLNSYFRADVELARFDAMKSQLQPYIAEFTHRWPNTYDWESGAAYGRAIAARRNGVRLGQLRGYFSLGNSHSLTLSGNPAHGFLKINSLTLGPDLPGVSAGVLPWTGSYFGSVPVRLEAEPGAGYRFLGWKRTVNGTPQPPAGYYSTSAVMDLTLTATTSMEAEFGLLPEPRIPVHNWTFASQAYHIPAFTSGGGLLGAIPMNGDTLVEAPDKGFATDHLRVNNPVNATLTLAMPASGFRSLKLDMITRRSGSGAGQMSISHTVDGYTWTPDGVATILDADPQPFAFDFTSTPGVDNNPRFAVRLTFSAGAGGTEGNNRFDDITLTGIAVPQANLPPFTTSVIPDKQVIATGAPVILNLTEHFSDPDNDPLICEAIVTNGSIAEAVMAGNHLTISGIGTGESRIVVNALFDNGVAASHVFNLLVLPPPADLSNGGFHFTGWNANEPAGAFPAHMLFTQGDVQDPALPTPLDHAYAIPPADAASPGDTALPYAASSRSRINGSGTEGITFTNTGRNRDVGAAWVAFRTTGLANIDVKWTAGTRTTGLRTYGLTLQYRLAIGTPWIDIPGTTYIATTSAGHEQKFGPFRLPSAAENQPYVQLRWKYHNLSGSGTRPGIRLDDIAIQAAGSYQAWAAKWFDSGELENPAVSSPAVGTNLLNYALGLSPASAPQDGYTAGRDGTGGIFIRFRRDPLLADIVYQVETSVNLNDWSNVIYDSAASVHVNSDGEYHEVLAPAAAARAHFIRLRVRYE